jgi:hypothetical protein
MYHYVTIGSWSYCIARNTTTIASSTATSLQVKISWPRTLRLTWASAGKPWRGRSRSSYTYGNHDNSVSEVELSVWIYDRVENFRLMMSTRDDDPNPDTQGFLEGNYTGNDLPCERVPSVLSQDDRTETSDRLGLIQSSTLWSSAMAEKETSWRSRPVMITATPGVRRTKVRGNITLWSVRVEVKSELASKKSKE